MFIGELIPGEQYITHTGELLQLTDVTEYYADAWVDKRDLRSLTFHTYTTHDLRKMIRDFN